MFRIPVSSAHRPPFSGNCYRTDTRFSIEPCDTKSISRMLFARPDSFTGSAEKQKTIETSIKNPRARDVHFVFRINFFTLRTKRMSSGARLNSDTKDIKRCEVPGIRLYDQSRKLKYRNLIHDERHVYRRALKILQFGFSRELLNGAVERGTQRHFSLRESGEVSS